MAKWQNGNRSYYINVVKKYVEYSAKKSARKPVQEYLDDISLLMRTFDSLDGYFQRHGVFKERSAVFTKHQQGKVNWSRTIQETVPVHVTCEVDGGISRPAAALEAVFYPTPVHQVTFQQESIVSLVFRKVLTLLATLITPLLDRPHPFCLHMRQDSVATLLLDLKEHQSYYIRVVGQQITREFGYRRAVLSSLLAFLRAEASVLDRAIRNKAFAFGVKKFSLVWEDACIRAVGGERGSQQLAKIRWHPRQGVGGEYHNRIDAKLTSERHEHITLVDAKYYIVDVASSENSEIIERAVPMSDVVKQFGYMIAYHLGTDTDIERIDSAFMCPSLANSYYSYMGKIAYDTSHNDNKAKFGLLQPINVFGVNPEYLFDAYLEDRKISELTSFIRTNHNVIEKVAFLKRKGILFRLLLRQDESGIKIIGDNGLSQIPWLADGNQIVRLSMMARDKGVQEILNDMHLRVRSGKEGHAYVLRDNYVVQSFENARFLLGGENQAARNSVKIEELDPS